MQRKRGFESAKNDPTLHKSCKCPEKRCSSAITYSVGQTSHSYADHSHQTQLEEDRGR